MAIPVGLMSRDEDYSNQRDGCDEEEQNVRLGFARRRHCKRYLFKGCFRGVREDLCRRKPMMFLKKKPQTECEEKFVPDVLRLICCSEPPRCSSPASLGLAGN